MQLFSCVNDFERQPIDTVLKLKTKPDGKAMGISPGAVKGLSLVYPGALLPPCLKTQCISMVKICSQRRN